MESAGNLDLSSDTAGLKEGETQEQNLASESNPQPMCLERGEGGAES